MGQLTNNVPGGGNGGEDGQLSKPGPEHLAKHSFIYMPRGGVQNGGSSGDGAVGHHSGPQLPVWAQWPSQEGINQLGATTKLVSHTADERPTSANRRAAKNVPNVIPVLSTAAKWAWSIFNSKPRGGSDGIGNDPHHRGDHDRGKH